MSDFMARIRAWLDTSEVEKQLNDLENSKKIKLGVDTSNTQKTSKMLIGISMSQRNPLNRWGTH